MRKPSQKCCRGRRRALVRPARKRCPRSPTPACPRVPGTSGEHISFQLVARRAGVSRQWLYTQSALRAEIEQLRDPARVDSVPARQRASEASLRQRLESLRAENQFLREENQSLRAELAVAYGRLRATA
ncbi:MAG: DUF6262 family protein [Actinobacteria bacterium]|nr:DUF6262 family protein [Actinomycetota bacterium]